MLAETVGKYYCVSIIGMCKNAGKTTVFNHIVSELHSDGGLALTSIGLDGESADVVTGTPKPRIHVRRGVLFATAEKLLPLCGVSREIVDTTRFSTPLGRVVILRARSDGFVQLAGPSIVAQLSEVSRLFRSIGAKKLIIDGALARKSPASTALAEGVILSTGASLGPDMLSVAEETAFACRMLTLPCLPPEELEADQGVSGARFTCLRGGEAEPCADFDELEASLRRGGVEALCVSGALTDSLADRLGRSGFIAGDMRVVAADSSHILLGPERYERLTRRGARLCVRRSTCLAAVTVNPASAYGWRFDPEAFLHAVRSRVDAPVYNVEG